MEVRAKSCNPRHAPVRINPRVSEIPANPSLRTARKGFKGGLSMVNGSWLTVDGDFRVPDLSFAAGIGPEDSLQELFMGL
jgi:hypothetical protein